ncbi:unnamed protein product [Ilex paraguariensis]|uniref:VQ domain-containing protein n=1 Tax=Ilex paraguariensis TaxID=185542 RepID=A0ABC8SDN1_9AQUA
MDSGNSGGMQSSSGGDEEYDSRAESISPFLKPSSHPPPPQSLPHLHRQPPTLFDPPPHTVDAFSQSPPNPDANSLYNRNLKCSKPLRYEANNMDFPNLTGLSSSPLQSAVGKAAEASPPSEQTHVVRNTKKRTRASRRAPTTVLTTDTSNFRQMVQQFTGIPTAPSSASPYSRRSDLFGPSSPTWSGNLKKVQLSPYVLSLSSPPLWNSSMIDATPETTNSITTSITGNSSSLNSTTYQLPSNIGISKETPNFLNMQNQILTFQSLLQSSSLPPLLKHPLANAAIFGTKSQENSSIPCLDELGLSHENVNTNLGGFPGHEKI